MKFADLVATVAGLPVFRGSLLLSGDRDPADVRRQLARWQASGRIVQLRRNVYALAEPWRRIEPHPFVIANELRAPSYVSLQSALSWHGLIPEAVPVTTSVTTGRPAEFRTALGQYLFRHVHGEVFFGYSRVAVLDDQEAFVADPAKALLDLVYLTPGGDADEYLESLRLSRLEALDEQTLRRHAGRWGKRKILRATDAILRIKRSSGESGEPDS
jgi:predicted transcriptional regulator of viral defense system